MIAFFLSIPACAQSQVQAGEEINPTGIENAPVLSIPTEASETEIPIPEITHTTTVTPELTSSPTPESSETPEPLSTLPDAYTISGVYGHKQYFPLGCETSVAVDWAAFFGVAINEFEFQHKLPLSDNPELGFVGSVEGPWGQVPPFAYGVHAAPVAALLREYGLNALAVKEMRLEELKRQIAMDRPVIAWVIGNVVGGVPYRYTDSQGNTTVVAAYEHTIIVFGYDPETIRYNNNGKVYDVPNDIFLNSWGVLGNMAIVMGEE